MLPTSQNPGALVISLDFELHWGVRDRVALDRDERARLLSARAVVPSVLQLFEEFSIHSTWATVGFLFARSREEMEFFSPSLLPQYKDPALNPYREVVGRDEADDPFHFAASLIASIATHRGQEIGTHSYSHFYCGESGQDALEFEADLRSAVAIANFEGYRIHSCVFPRNQVRSDYLDVLKRNGITCYRGTQAGFVNRAGSFRFQQSPHRRLIRLCDNYIDLFGPQTVDWPAGPAPRSIAASRYLRPWSEMLAGFEEARYRRIAGAMTAAAGRGELFHLWWHPEDFARNRDRNLQFLRRVLVHFEHCRREFGMLSLSMSEAAGLGDRNLLDAPLTAPERAVI